jgi:LmbE family N-acetylglucosaminyl deacetylase
MRVQFFSPHPDDIELFCGGSFLKHLDDGCHVQTIQVSRGELGTLKKSLQGENIAKIRTSELLNYYAPLNIDVKWLDIPDGEIQVHDKAICLFRSAIQSFRPDLIYIPESKKEISLYEHPDHLATGQLVEEALSCLGCIPKRRYYHSLRKEINKVVDISPYFRASKKALRHHKSQYSYSASPPFLLYYVGYKVNRDKCKLGRSHGYSVAEGFREVLGSSEQIIDTLSLSRTY